jgi:hypothetical protein
MKDWNGTLRFKEGYECSSQQRAKWFFFSRPFTSAGIWFVPAGDIGGAQRACTAPGKFRRTVFCVDVSPEQHPVG